MPFIKKKKRKTCGNKINKDKNIYTNNWNLKSLLPTLK